MPLSTIVDKHLDYTYGEKSHAGHILQAVSESTEA